MNRLRVTSRTSLIRLHKVIRASVAAGAVAFAVAASAPAPRPGPLPGAGASDTTRFFRYPSGIAVGADGRVYVASAGDSSVVVFAPGALGLAAPVRRIGRESGLVYPRGVTLDSRGDLYISSGRQSGDGRGSITVYAPGATGDVAPLRIIGGPRTQLSQPTAIALGADRKLYVVNGPTSRANLFNGMAVGLGSEVLVFDPRASGDTGPDRHLVEISDTVNSSPSLAQAPAPRLLDTICGKATAPNRAVICATSPHNDPKAQPARSDPQPPDTAKPVDLAVGAGGRLLVLTRRGVTTYGRDSVQHREQPVDFAGDRYIMSGYMSDRPRLAQGPRGEIYLARKIPSTGPGQTGFGQAGLAELFMRLQSPGTPAPKGPIPRDSLVAAMSAKFKSMSESIHGRSFISVYAPGTSGDTTPVRTIAGDNTGLGQIADLTVGPDGSLYVLIATSSSRGDRIAVYSPTADGDVPPVRTVEGPGTGLMGSTSLTLDREGNIYVTHDRANEDHVFGAATVTVHARDAAGDAPPLRTISGWSTLLRKPTGVAVEDDGTIYVTNLETYNDDFGSVQTYAADASEAGAPARVLIGQRTAIAGPAGLAIGRGDTIFVLSAGAFTRRVTVYPPRSGKQAAPIRTLEGRETKLEEPRAITVDSEGKMYIADSRGAAGINAYGPDLGAVRIYRAGAEGKEAPVRTIMGSYTRLNGPSGVAIGHHGNIYVVNRWGTGPGSVTVYGPDAEGDVRPLRMIAGPSTGLEHPAALALDARDTLYVVNERTVTVYPPGVAGDVAPVRTIGRK